MTNDVNFTIHGVLLEVFQQGVLLCGESSVGKSELALDLIQRSHQLVADDAVMIHREQQTLIGSCPPLLKNFIEIKGLGIIDVPAIYGPKAIKEHTYISLIIHLLTEKEHKKIVSHTFHDKPRLRRILGITLPEIQLLTTLNQHLSVLVECAVKNQLLIKQGYNANMALQKRHQNFLEQNYQEKLNEKGSALEHCFE